MLNQTGTLKCHLPAKAGIILTLLLVVITTIGVTHATAAASLCTGEYMCASYELEQPDAMDPQLAVTQVTHAYTGPGADYLNYGDLPAGYTSHVTGVSQDGKWLVIPLPAQIAPDGIGWVNAALVSAKNVQIMPEWLAKCDPATYCGYVLSHSPQYVSVRQPSPHAPKYGDYSR